MQIGKVPNDILNELVIKKMKRTNERVLLPAGIGEDFAAIDLGGEYCVVSGDPVTGTEKFAGKTAVHVACNDIATCGVAPLAILTTLLLPPGTTEADLGSLADEIAEAAASIGVSVIGGHTEVTDAVSRTVISVTAIGAASREKKLIATGGAKPGDAIVMTKTAAIEGTALIAAGRGGELAARFGAAFVERAKAMSGDISVVREGLLAGGFGVSAMHDATEGGILGAAWEMAEASGNGLTVFLDKIPVTDETRTICSHFNVDPYRLISSGSMLIATDRAGALIALLSESGIRASNIATIGGGASSRNVVSYNGYTDIIYKLEQPGPDELYKVL